MTPTEHLRMTILELPGVSWASHGDPAVDEDGDPTPGWVKFGLQHSELGWRALEFLAWVFEDLTRAGRHILFFPPSAPPHLNTPGRCLAFAVECYPNEEYPDLIAEVNAFLLSRRSEHWDDCMIGLA
jgi:hypothetical protein